ADSAQDDFADFQQGLRATHDETGRSMNSVVAHSYGNVVLGQAASHHNLDVDKMMIVGGAGGGDGVRNVSDLGMAPEDVYAVTDEDDFIRVSPYAVHGPQAIQQHFGLPDRNVLESDAGTGDPMATHGAYWDLRNPARRNLARIIAGKEPL
ncbi:MAG: alpha/beta hydrolase, partial [Thermocrispum sp.]